MAEAGAGGDSYLPYHPQFVPAKTQVLTQLAAPLMFGTTDVTSEEASSLGPTTAPTAWLQPGSPVRFRPHRPWEKPWKQWFPSLSLRRSPAALPAGTRLTGTVLDVQPARFWRRGGQLRFAFNELQLPPAIESDHSVSAINGTVVKLQPIESGGIRVDSEGRPQLYASQNHFVHTNTGIFGRAVSIRIKPVGLWSVPKLE